MSFAVRQGWKRRLLEVVVWLLMGTLCAGEW